MKKFFDEFREFVSRGNVVDLAVGVIIGGAFQAIVNSLVNDIISPLVGLFAQKDFSAWKLEFLGIALKYGSFITAIVNFLIMAFVIFLLVKAINKINSINKKEEIQEAPTTKKCPYCMSEIDINATRCPNCTSELN